MMRGPTSSPFLAHAGGVPEIASTILVFGALWTAWVAWNRLRGKGFGHLPAVAAWAMLPAAAVLTVAALILPPIIARTATSAPAGPRPASTAKLMIERPTRGQKVSGPNMDVVLSLTGGRIVQAATMRLTPGTGHIHLSIDGRVVSMTFGTLQVVDVSRIAPGPHTLQAEFVAADHGPFDPRVIAIVPFQVRR